MFKDACCILRAKNVYQVSDKFGENQNRANRRGDKMTRVKHKMVRNLTEIATVFANTFVITNLS